MEKYKILKSMGDGTYGAVFKAEDTQTGEIVAIKKMKKKYKSWEDCMALREVKSLRRMNHPNLVRLKEVVQVKNELQLVFEYMELNLYQFYMRFKEKRSHIPEQLIKRIILQVALGLDSLHKIGYFHRDLKPENLLINQNNYHVKVCDFGLAREVRCRPPFTEYVSTRWYRAPEILLHSSSYNSPIDIFALGCIMAELYNLAPLFSGANELDQFYKMVNLLGTPQNWTEGIKLAQKSGVSIPKREVVPLQQVVPRASPEALQLLNDMLQYDSSKRPTAQQITKYAYFDDVIHEFAATISSSNSLQSSSSTMTPAANQSSYPSLLGHLRQPPMTEENNASSRSQLRQSSIHTNQVLQPSQFFNINTNVAAYSNQMKPMQSHRDEQSVYQQPNSPSMQQQQHASSQALLSSSNYHFTKQPHGLSSTQDVGAIIGGGGHNILLKKIPAINFGGTLERPINMQHQYHNDAVKSSRKQHALLSRKSFEMSTQMHTQPHDTSPVAVAAASNIRYPGHPHTKDASSYFNQFTQMQGGTHINSNSSNNAFYNQFNAATTSNYLDDKRTKRQPDGGGQNELAKIYEDKLNWAF